MFERTSSLNSSKTVLIDFLLLSNPNRTVEVWFNLSNFGRLDPPLLHIYIYIMFLNHVKSLISTSLDIDVNSLKVQKMRFILQKSFGTFNILILSKSIYSNHIEYSTITITIFNKIQDFVTSYSKHNALRRI